MGDERVGRRSWSARERVDLGPHGCTTRRVQAGRASGVLNPPAHATTNTALRRAGGGTATFGLLPAVDLQGRDHLEPTELQPRIPCCPSTIGPTCP